MKSPAILLAAFLAATAPAHAAKYTIIDPPNSRYTLANGINNDGDIVGSYQVGNEYLAGFLRAADGAYTTFRYKDKGTDASAINDKRWIAGHYLADGFYSGFVRKPNGHMESFSPAAESHVYVTGMDQKGDVAGFTTNIHTGISAGFIRATDGAITPVSPPGAHSTQCGSMNRSGMLTGWFVDDSGVYHGFIRALDGTFSVFDVPDSDGTFAQSINDNGTVAGFYIRDDGIYPGFVRDPSGVLTTYETNAIYPDSSVYSAIVNQKDEIAGFIYYDFAGYRAFMRTASGKLKLIDPPDEPGSPSSEATGVNKNGAMVGWYSDLQNITHGFLRAP
ncbi:MAG TPA: hypothetical protein VHU18_13030 [Rhizomicrobium sp.]|jgi:hypothetical protein|nr:hypothetical protein [Rhizomicrobium sp.]